MRIAVIGCALDEDIAAAVTCTGEPVAEPETGEHTVTPATAAKHVPEVEPLLPEVEPPEPEPDDPPDVVLLELPKNSPISGAVAAPPGKLLIPSASRTNRNVLWCW
jgi:hypothetical protein